jgi:hypothetical protein
MALNSFVLSLDAAALYPSVIPLIHPFVPDSFVAATTPLYTYNDYDPAFTQNFAAGDLSVAGLAGDGGSKYLNTGFTPSQFMTSNSGSVIIYQTATGSASGEMVSSVTGGGGHMRIAFDSASLGNYMCMWDDAQSFGVGNTTSWFKGYLCHTKTSASARAIYEANSTTPHFAAATSSSSGTSGASTLATYAFVGNEGGTLTNYMAVTLSFLAFGVGLTAAQSASLYPAVQTLRKNLGGGWV